MHINMHIYKAVTNATQEAWGKTAAAPKAGEGA